jgi:hypothetical protein
LVFKYSRILVQVPPDSCSNNPGFSFKCFGFRVQVWPDYAIVALNECPTDSEHVNRVSIFVCDKAHDKNDMRWADEMKRYFDGHHFPPPDFEAPEPCTGGKPPHSL